MGLVMKAQLAISLGQAIARQERYIQQLKEKNVEPAWIEAFETRRKALEKAQEDVLNTVECEQEASAKQ